MHLRLHTGAARDALNLDLKRLQTALDRLSDGAVAHDQDSLAGQVFGEHAVEAARCARLEVERLVGAGKASPLLLALHIAVVRETLHGAEDGADDPFRGGDVVDAAPVAQEHALWQPGQDPVHAGHHGLDDLHASQLGEGLFGFAARKRQDPEVHIDGRLERSAEPYEFCFGRKAG